MKRASFAAVVLAAVLGASVVVAETPTAPAPRDAKPRFVAPPVNGSLEVFVLTTTRPVHIRITAGHNGQTLDQLWRHRMKKLFDFCDRDADGYLSATELDFTLTDPGLAQLLATGFYQVGLGSRPRLADIDHDNDGRVAFEEFLAAYPRTVAQILRSYPVQQDFVSHTAITEALFQLIDANHDGQLTQAEVQNVEKLLPSRDRDEDECLTIQELVPHIFDPVYGRYLGSRLPRTPTADAMNQTVMVYDTERIPGTLTLQILQRYDADGDLELTRAESGFDAATFQRLDTDNNGRLDSAELDRWRTGEPDLELMLSLGEQAGDCVATVRNEKAAVARGFVFRQVEPGRLVVQVDRQSIDLGAFTPVIQYRPASLKQQYEYLFTQAAGKKDHLVDADLTGPNAVRYQFLRVIFEAADRNGDGQLTKDEFDAYFDLQESFRNLSLSLTAAVQTPSLFQLLDENREGRLSVRELRNAWPRLLALEDPKAKVVTKRIIQPAINLRLTRTFERSYYLNQPSIYNPNPTQVTVPTQGPLWFRKMDRNGDGDLSRGEFLGTPDEFAAIDTDGDGLISLAEAWDQKMRPKAKKEEK
jgi:Ca2+-binding EF-hand superfamily protein